MYKKCWDNNVRDKRPRQERLNMFEAYMSEDMCQIEVPRYKMSEAKTEVSDDKMFEGSIHVWEVFSSECLRYTKGVCDASANVHT